MQRIRGVGGAIQGHYRVAQFSGITTGLGANAILFAARWATTATLRAAITRLRCFAQILTPFTAAQEIQVAAYLCSAFTANDTGGTVITPPPAGQNSLLQFQESAQASQFSDLRIASATALGAGTRTPDTLPFAIGLGAQLLAAAAGSQNIDLLDYEVDSDQKWPVILQGGGYVGHGGSTLVPANAQGIEIQSPIAQGAGGTVRFGIELEWLEYNWDSTEVIN